MKQKFIDNKINLLFIVSLLQNHFSKRVDVNFRELQALVAQSCLTLCDPMDYSPPDSSVYGILRARILEWVAISLSILLSHFSRVRLCVTPEMAAPRLLRPWDSPGKNSGVGCHFLLQCMKVKSESEVAQSCPTLRDPMDCSLPGSSVHGIFQARVLEWGAIAFSILIH